MKCPRCQSAITAAPDPNGFIVCPGCGAKLRRAAAPAAAKPSHHFPDGTNPNATLPPGTPLPSIPRRVDPAARGAVRGEDPTATPVAGLPRKAMADRLRAAAAAAPAPVPERERAAPPDAAAEAGPSLAAILAEVQAVRRMQEEILELLRREPFETPASPAAAFGGMEEPGAAGALPPLRTRRRKSALVIDDDEATRAAMVAAFEAAEVPVRAVGDGNAAVAAIADEKPDVLVLELDLAGPMAGKDVVNVIKATMEWVDIPILLYTRLKVESQKEARTVHGGDDFVLKGPGAPEAVVARAIAFFRKR